MIERARLIYVHARAPAFAIVGRRHFKPVCCTSLHVRTYITYGTTHDIDAHTRSIDI